MLENIVHNSWIRAGLSFLTAGLFSCADPISEPQPSCSDGRILLIDDDGSKGCGTCPEGEKAVPAFEAGFFQCIPKKDATYSSSEVKSEKPTFCCGRIIYLPTSGGSKLSAFDLSSKKESVLADLTTLKSSNGNSIEFSQVVASANNSTLGLSYYTGGCGGTDVATYFYLLSAQGTNPLGISYPNQDLGCLLVSGSQYNWMGILQDKSVVSVLESGLDNSHQIFKVKGGITKITRPANGVNYVHTLVVSPDGKVYFSYFDLSGSLGVGATDANGNEVKKVASLNYPLREMDWVPGRNQILAREHKDSSELQKVVLVDLAKGTVEYVTDSVYSFVVDGTSLLVSPDGKKFMHTGAHNMLFDLDSHQDVPITEPGFHCCKSESRSVWLP